MHPLGAEKYPQYMLNRRIFLLGAAALPVAACSRPSSPPVDIGFDGPGGGCRTPDSLTGFSTVGGAPIGYEISGVEQGWRADPAFVELLEAWAADWVALSGLGPIRRISTYGVFVDKCDSWHAAGRAFDFATVEHDGITVSCRYDLYGDGAAELPLYWRLAASLNKWFTYTLTYSYNEQHHNHIHIDNGVSGYEATGFSERSNAQVQAVQGIARHVFGLPVAESGRYDGETREAVREIQRGAGITVPLRDPEGWRAFLDAAVAPS